MKTCASIVLWILTSVFLCTIVIFICWFQYTCQNSVCPVSNKFSYLSQMSWIWDPKLPERLRLSLTYDVSWTIHLFFFHISIFFNFLSVIIFLRIILKSLQNFLSITTIISAKLMLMPDPQNSDRNSTISKAKWTQTQILRVLHYWVYEKKILAISITFLNVCKHNQNPRSEGQIYKIQQSVYNTILKKYLSILNSTIITMFSSIPEK